MVQTSVQNTASKILLTLEKMEYRYGYVRIDAIRNLKLLGGNEPGDYEQGHRILPRISQFVKLTRGDMDRIS